jgi:hypothetical protein
MPVICPKCSHVRPPDATNPDWQCPACGICYAKFGSQPAAQARPLQYAEIDAGQGWNLGWLFKILLLVALGWGLGVAMERRQKAPDAEAAVALAPQETDAGVAIANTALRVSEAESSMLHSLSGRLERACARNKYGLSEQACVARLREREDACATQTAQRFPGQIGDTGRMEIITRAYVACIFEAEDGH